MPSSKIKSGSVVVALTWTYGAYITGFVAQLASLVVLARLLQPLDFGIFAACTLVIEGISTLTAPGLRIALLQRREHEDVQLDTVWTTELLHGLVVAVFIVVAAPVFPRLLGIPEMADPLRALALVPLASGAVNPAIVGFLRRLDMRRQFWMTVPGDVGRRIVSIAIALWSPTVWALVVGYVAGVATQTIASYLVVPYRPRLRLDWIELRSLYRFSGWLHLQHVLTWTQRRLDSAIIGRLLGGAELGYYDRASTIVAQPRQQLNDAVQQVTFPMFAALQSEPARASRAFTHAFNLALLTTMPVVLAALAFPSELINVLLGARWASMSFLLQVLALAVAARVVLDATLPMFRGLGVPRVEFTILAINSVVVSVLLYPCVSRWGAPGAGVALSAGALATFPVAIHYLRTVAGIRMVDWVPNLLGTAIAMMASWAVVMQCRSSQLHSGVLLLVAAAGTYAVTLLLLEPLMRTGTLKTLRAAARAYAQR